MILSNSRLNKMLSYSFLFVLLTVTSCNKNPSVEETPETEETEQPASNSFDPTAMRRGFMLTRIEDINKPIMEEAKKWGANLVRIQLYPGRFAKLKKKSTVKDAIPAYLNKLEERLKWAKEIGLKVAIDLHQVPLFINGEPIEDESPTRYQDFWNDPKIKSSLINFWKEAATKFKGKYDDVIMGYDIYNEPGVYERNQPPANWRGDIAPAIVKAIREIDKNKWIIYQVGPWAQAIGYGSKELKPLDDKKVLYSVHFYSPNRNFTHQGLREYNANNANPGQAIKYTYPGNIPNHNNSRIDYWDKAALRKELDLVDAFSKKYNVPIYVGEFSVIIWADVPSAIRWLTDVTDYFEEKKWPWTYHSFREWQGWSPELPEGVYWIGKNYPNRLSGTTSERGKLLKKLFQKNTN